MTAAVLVMAHRGRALPEMWSKLFVDLDGFRTVGQLLEAEGYALRPCTVPFHREDGSVLIRLVWRRRRDGACTVVQQLVRGDVPGPVLDALMDAVAVPAARRP